MGPGPSDVHSRVLQAMARPTVGHLDPYFVELMDDTKRLLKYAFKTDNELTFPVSAPGSAGMETCFANLIEQGDKVIVLQNGVFGGRMKENVVRMGGECILQETPWGEAVQPSALEELLNDHDDVKIVAFVHAETSTGALSDAQALSKVAHKFGCLVIVDTVTSLAGSELLVDEWELDAVYSGSQKCLSCTPGISPVTFSQRAINKIKSRKTPCQSWFLDLNLVMGYWGEASKRSYHHTAPVNALYGFHESLVMLHEEGLENSWKRHIEMHEKLIAGLESIGLKALVKKQDRIPQLNAVLFDSAIDEAAIRTKLLNQYDLEIGAGLGPFAGKIWRIGLMGTSASLSNVNHCINSLKSLLP
ncbi:MAG: alanine--glyoxylate aminotransferase family protein [Candidatus Cloacimonetes bacterium]|nr:alanine--glyoxylate aminotransferase family protein [Candidatus Cloacimonadota bacterium]